MHCIERSKLGNFPGNNKLVMLSLCRTMTKEKHRAGTKEGHEMAIAIRDLWRSYGISVRIEQHKTILTK